MVNNFHFTDLIVSNLTKLTDATIIEPDIIIRLLEKKLITDAEKVLLMDFRTPNSERSLKLYTVTAKRWTESCFEEFKEILKETGNLRAYGILINTKVGVHGDTGHEMELLKAQMDKNVEGRYEGVSLELEDIANRIVEKARNSQQLKNGKVQLEANANIKEFITLLRGFKASLETEQVWWNPIKPPLLRNHISRKVCKSNRFNSDGSLIDAATAKTKTLLEINEELVVLVCPAGMGKSTELTHLEQNLRKKYKENRVIVRVNLNKVQSTLSSISSKSSAEAVLFKLAPFLPSKILQSNELCVFLLLDGLDEVCPMHEYTVINLLRILLTSKDGLKTNNKIKVFVSTRPYLKQSVLLEFNVQTWSFVPITVEEQNSYIEAELCLSNEQLQSFHSSFPKSIVNMLANPQMLSMLVDILKSRGNISALDANTFDLYSRFMESRHEFYIVEKMEMHAGDNFTEMQLRSTLERNLPFYYHIAINELLIEEDAHDTRSINEFKTEFTESIGRLTIEPSLSTASGTELLSYGIVIPSSENRTRLTFKHRSYAEFFYSKLLLGLWTPQPVRDTLYGFIYGRSKPLENLEDFVSAALSNAVEDSYFRLTTKWLLIPNHWSSRCRLLVEFVRGKLFPLLVGQVLLTFVAGDPNDLREVFLVLVRKRSREAFTKLYEWMRENREWSRQNIFNMSGNVIGESEARLAVAIAVAFEDQLLFSQAEVTTALESVSSLICILAAISCGKKNKWNVVEKHLGANNLKGLVWRANEEELNKLIKDAESVWMLFTTFSQSELLSLLSEATRATDILGTYPLTTLVALGEEVITPFCSQLAQFKAKFGDTKGKLVFELSGCIFALDILWGNLLQEMKAKNRGTVTTALREAIVRRSDWGVLGKIEEKIRRGNKCGTGEFESKVMQWVVDSSRLWDSLSFFPLQMLPFVVLFSGSAHHVRKFIENSKQNVGDTSTLMAMLRSLIISTYHDNSFVYLQIVAILMVNLPSIPTKWRSMTQILITSKQEDLRSSNPVKSSFLVSEVSVGQTLIGLTTREPSAPADTPWMEIVGDVIQFTHCCEIPSTLQKLRKLPDRNLRRILMSNIVLFHWEQRLSSRHGTRKKVEYECALKSLLSFYFEIFGLNLEWMREEFHVAQNMGAAETYLIGGLPVEIVTTLEGSPQWSHLVPQFQEMAKKFLRSSNISSVNRIAGWFPYRTEVEWEKLLSLIGEDFFQQGTPNSTIISTARAAPLIRVLIRSFGLQGTKWRVKTMWDQIPTDVEISGESLQTKASLLHSAIRLGEMEEVESRSYPVILPWTDEKGMNAMEVSEKNWGENHSISTHLRQRWEIMTRFHAENNITEKCIVS